MKRCTLVIALFSTLLGLSAALGEDWSLESLRERLQTRVEAARDFCSRGEELSCDAYLCKLLFDGDEVDVPGLSDKRSANKGVHGPYFGNVKTHLRFGRRKRSIEYSQDKCAELNSLIEKFIQHQ